MKQTLKISLTKILGEPIKENGIVVDFPNAKVITNARPQRLFNADTYSFSDEFMDMAKAEHCTHICVYDKSLPSRIALLEIAEGKEVYDENGFTNFFFKHYGEK